MQVWKAEVERQNMKLPVAEEDEGESPVLLRCLGEPY